MTQETSPLSGRAYPVALACRVFGLPRSSYYGALLPKRTPPRPRTKRGPKSLFSDEELCAEIQAVLKGSPFHGEGYRKVRARLVARGYGVGANRVLRLMREQGWLAPVRTGHPHGPKAHDGTIVTERPDEVWGTDATRFYTRQEGWCWWFGAVDHYTDEVVGWSVAKVGTRYVAMDPIRQGCGHAFGDCRQDVGRGLKVRCDHGSQYLSRAFQAEMAHLGIEISWAFVGEPQGNGVAERFIRTLKEQCLWLHDFETLQEAQGAIDQFIRRYNGQWLIQRLGYRSPAQARQDYLRERFALAAA